MLKFIYTIFVGLLLVAFVGLGIDAFYPGPERPELPASLERSIPIDEDELTKEEKEQLQQEREEYNKVEKEARGEYRTYNRNISMISIAIAVIILSISIAYSSKFSIIADGLILGGVFTLAYGIIRGFASEDSMFRFIVVTVGLIIAFILGYVKFIKPQASSK